MAGHRKQPGRRPPRGAEYTTTDGELTLRGQERADQLGADDLVVERDQSQRHAVQNRALWGLTLLLVEVLLLGTLAMVGTAAGWWRPEFALQVLAITLAPSFSAWVIVLRWAFRRS